MPLVASNTRTGNQLFPAIAIGICLIISFWPALLLLFRQWGVHADYSHGYLILPLAFYLSWKKRHELKAAPIYTDWRALPLVFIAAWGIVLGELGAELFTSRVAMLMLLVGVVWLTYGLEVLRVLQFPFAFLLLMFPPPGFIYRNLTLELQLLASVWSVQLSHLLGIAAFREGNVIDIGFTKLQVAEACSGLHYLLPLLTFGLLTAYLGHNSLWKRGVLIVAAIPIAIAANIVRVTGTVVIAAQWGGEAAKGFFHFFSGWAVFMVCAGCFVFLNLTLRGLGERTPVQEPKVHRFRTISADKKMGWPSLAIGVAIILIIPFLVDFLGRVSPRPLRQPLAAFPAELDGWTGERGTMDPEIKKLVAAQDYGMLDYRKPGRNPISFYAAYYEHQKKAGGFAHSPRLCLPGAGWFIEEERERTIGSPSGAMGQLRFNELVIEKNGERHLVYFWYQGRGRNFTSEYAAKGYMVWDGLWMRRTDGALVRLMSPLEPAQSLDTTREAMDAFALAAFQALEAHLPQ